MAEGAVACVCAQTAGVPDECVSLVAGIAGIDIAGRETVSHHWQTNATAKQEAFVAGMAPHPGDAAVNGTILDGGVQCALAQVIQLHLPRTLLAAGASWNLNQAGGICSG